MTLIGKVSVSSRQHQQTIPRRPERPALSSTLPLPALTVPCSLKSFLSDTASKLVEVLACASLWNYIYSGVVCHFLLIPGTQVLSRECRLWPPLNLHQAPVAWQPLVYASTAFPRLGRKAPWQGVKQTHAHVKHRHILHFHQELFRSHAASFPGFHENSDFYVKKF